MAYQPDHQDTIREIFTLEGDALARKKFVEPSYDEDQAPEGYDRGTTPVMPEATREAYDLYLKIGEVAYEG